MTDKRLKDENLEEAWVVAFVDKPVWIEEGFDLSSIQDLFLGQAALQEEGNNRWQASKDHAAIVGGQVPLGATAADGVWQLPREHVARQRSALPVPRKVNRRRG